MTDFNIAVSTALNLLTQQAVYGPLSDTDREALAALLEIVNKTKPCIHCGKDPHA